MRPLGLGSPDAPNGERVFGTGSPQVPYHGPKRPPGLVHEPKVQHCTRLLVDQEFERVAHQRWGAQWLHPPFGIGKMSTYNDHIYRKGWAINGGA